jgi:hypothetical protein
LTERLSSKSGDRFVVRFYSPLETVGGGVILDPDPPKRRRNDSDALEALKVRESGSAGDRIYQAAVKSAGIASREALQRQLDMDEEEFAREAEALAGQGRLVELWPGCVIADAGLGGLSRRAPDCWLSITGAIRCTRDCGCGAASELLGMRHSTGNAVWASFRERAIKLKTAAPRSPASRCGLQSAAAVRERILAA